MISIPYKRTQHIKLHQALTTYISSHHPTGTIDRPDVQADITQLCESREAILRIDTANPAVEGALLAYLRILQGCSIQTLLPLGSDSGITVQFPWSDALRPQHTTLEASWAYETAAVAYNHATAIEQQAAQVDRTTADGAAAAAQGFMKAAAAYNTITDRLAPALTGTLPFDMCGWGLALVRDVCLAQAQACYMERARNNSMKPATVARLAAGAAQAYSTALKQVPPAATRELDAAFGWTAYLRAQELLYSAVAARYQARVAFAEAEVAASGHGTEIAWLNKAHALTMQSRQAAHEAKQGLTVHDELLSALNAQLKQAHEDNDTIYMSSIPNAAELPSVVPALMAKLGPAPAWTEPGAPELFTALLPAGAADSLARIQLSMEQAKSGVAARAQTLSSIAMARLHEQGLPGILEAARPVESSDSATAASAVPADASAAWQRVHAMQLQGGLPELHRVAASNEEYRTVLRSMLEDAEAALSREASEDAMHRSAGAPPPAATAEQYCASVRQQIEQLREVTSQAQAVDHQLQAQLTALEPRLAEIPASVEALAASLPDPASGGATSDTEAWTRARKACDAVEELLASAADRGSECLVQAAAAKVWGPELRACGSDEAAAAAVVKRAAVRMESTIDTWAEEFSAQLDSAVELALSLAKAWQQGSGGSSTAGARATALTKLQTTVTEYNQLLGQLKQGSAFYAGMRTRAEMLWREATDMLSTRRMERQQLLGQASSPRAGSGTSVDDLQARLAALQTGGTSPAVPARGSSTVYGQSSSQTRGR